METPDPQRPTDADTARELAKVEFEQFEPLLPAKKWLIGGSLALGVVLLGLLPWVSRTYFSIAQ